MDFELANLVMKTIEDEPETWNQGTWASVETAEESACKTTACFAGHTLVVSGQYKIVLDPNCCGSCAAFQNVETGKIVPDTAASTIAGELLGLNGRGRSLIFELITADLAELRETVEDVFSKPKLYSV